MSMRSRTSSHRRCAEHLSVVAIGVNVCGVEHGYRVLLLQAARVAGMSVVGARNRAFGDI
jgi:hypothetical protein